MARGMVDMAVQWSENGRTSWIQIMTTGNWNHPKLGNVRITPDDLARFKENFDKRVRGVNLFVDVSHNPDNGAVGEFKDLEIRGNQLWAKVDWNEEGAQLIKSGKFNYFSPEFMFSWTDPASGTEYKDVLMGGALTNRPFLKNMERVALSETDDMFQVQFADGESGDDDLDYDPDGDGDDDSSTDPKENPDWMQDVTSGITPWPSHDPEQQKQLMRNGATKEAADAAFSARQKQLGGKSYGAKMSEKLISIMLAEDKVTNAHKSPPKGKPQDKSQYADPEHYKYPIDAKHIHAALGYFNQGGQKESGGYSDSQWAEIGGKIASAANRLIGPGHEFKDGKINSPSSNKMDDGTTGTKENPDGGDTKSHPTDDNVAGQFSESGGGKMPDNVVSLSEFQAVQQRLQLVETENRRIKMTERVDGWLQAGKFVPSQRDKTIDMLMTMSEEQVQKFSEMVAEMPKSVNFGEVGFGGAMAGAGAAGGDKSQAVVKLAEQKMRDEKIEWKEAFIAASEELGVS